MDLRDYYKIIRRQKKIIILTSLSIVLIYLLILILWTPQTYIASSSIMLKPPTLEERIFATVHGIGTIPRTTTMNVENQIQLMQETFFGDILKNVSKKFKYKILQKNIYQLGSTNIIKIEIRSDNKDLAKELANETAEFSVNKNREMAKKEFTVAKEYIEKQLFYYQDRLQKVDGEIREFNKKEGVFDFDREVLAKINRLSEYQIAREQLNIEREQANFSKSQISSLLKKEPKFITDYQLQENPLILEFKKQIFPLELELLKLKENYTEEHPKIKAKEEQIKNLKKEMSQKIEKFVSVPTTSYNPTHSFLFQELLKSEMEEAGISVREKILNDYLEKEKNILSNLSDKQLTYAKLLREKNTAEKLLETLSGLLEQMKVYEVMKLGNAEVLTKSDESVPIRKTAPQKVILILLLSGMIGLGFGVGAEYMDETLRTPHFVKHYLEIPVLGTIPRVSSSNSLLINNLPFKSPVTDAYNKISLQIEKMLSEQNIKNPLIVCTSPRKKEGKSTILVNLAIALSRANKKVILLDFDLRRPSLHNILEVGGDLPGITEILTGELEAKKIVQEIKEGTIKDAIPNEILIEEVLIETKIPNLYLLPTGSLTQDVVSLLRKKEEIGEILSILKSKGDYIFCDTPPVLGIPDALMIGGCSDGILLILDALSSKKRESLTCKNEILSLGLKILGVILNNVEEKEEHYYYYYYKK